ncbi:Nn.00g110260.m01.CDS01 [Neocucurbitaria sp. VM-36]
MDDLAASQQLIDEGAEADHQTDYNGEDKSANGTRSYVSASRKKRKSGGASKPKELSTPQAAASQVAWPKQPVPVPFRSYALSDLQAFTDSDEAVEALSGWPVSPLKSPAPNIVLQPNDNIEVPDSQAAPTATHALMSPPMTSSLAVPASLPEQNHKHKKSNKRKRKEVVSSHNVLDDENRNRGEDKVAGTSEVFTPSPARAKRQRRLSSINSPKASSQADPIRGETSSARKKRGDKKNKTNGIETCDRPASVREPRQRGGEQSALGHEEDAQDGADNGHTEFETPSQKRRKKTKSKSKPNAPVASSSGLDLSEPLENSSGEDEIPSVPPSTHQGSAKKPLKTKAHKLPRLSQTPRRIRTSNVGPTNVLTAAERSLNTVRDLNYPPNLQTGGDFTHDEEELIRRAIRDYQERKGLDTSELVEVIQWTDDTKDISLSRRRSDRVIREVQDEQDSIEFWEEMKHVNLTRKMETVRNHIRSRYHTYKSGGWTQDEDEQLKNLFDMYPRQWKLISQAMGDRSMHDVHNRWRDYVQYGDKRNTSTWSHNEESLLVRAITTVVQRDEDYRAEVGKKPLNEYTNRDINWVQVCSLMGNIRSRLQCTVKWTKMQSRNPPPRIQLKVHPRETLVTDQDEEKISEQTPNKRGRPRKSDAQLTPQSSRKRGRPRKSEDVSVVDMFINQARKRRKSKRSDVAALESQEEKGDHRPGAEVSTPPPQGSTVIGTPGLGQMRWGDKFDLMEAILNREKNSAENIDWQDVAAAMQHSWSVRTLQAAQQLLFETVREKDLVDAEASFEDLADAVLSFLTEEHGDELKDHYDPYADAELDEGFDEPATAKLPTSKRRRKMGARDSTPRSQPTSAKKKTLSGFRPTTSETFKSAELITDSDDADEG